MSSHLSLARGTGRFEVIPHSESSSPVVRPSVSIIVPTLNEVGNIDQILSEIVENVSPHYNFEIIVADGGSTDGTREKVVGWAARHPVVLLACSGAGGLAGDVRAAASRAKFSILVVLDADGSHPASSIAELVRPVASGRSDMVIGSRYVEGGLTVGWPLRRRILSRLGAAFASPFTDINDPLSGFFSIRRERFLATGAHAEGFKIGLEAICAGGDDLRVSEVPISFSDRRQGTSKIGASQFVAYLKQLVRFSRGTTSSDAAHRFFLVGMVGFLLDLAAVSAMSALGAGMTAAHISGFCFATAFNYIGHAQWSFEGRPRENTRIARFMLLSVLALAMRGGFIATAAGPLGLPFFWAVTAGIFGGSVVNYIGSEFYVFRNSLFLSSTARWKIAAIGIVAYVVILRIVYQGNIDLIPQEAYYWNYAQHLDWGYLDHPPMVAWMIWAGTSIFGNSEFGVRIGATVSWLVTAFFVFRLTHNLFGRTQAFLAVLLLSILPFFFFIGTLMTPDAPLTAAWAGALYFLERAIAGNRARAWLGAGVCIGLGMLSKYTIALLGPAALAFLMTRPKYRRWVSTKWPYLCAGAAGVLFTPVIGWNAAHDWASFAFQGSRRWLSDDIRFSAHTLVAVIAALLGPVGVYLAGATIDKFIRLPVRLSTRSPAAFILVFTLVPLAVFIVFSLLHGVKLNWTGPVWLALLPAMANVVAPAARQGRMPRFLAALRMGTAASTLVFGLFLHYLALGLPFVGYSGSLRGLPIAWEEFGSRVQQIKANVEVQSGYSPLLVGMDTYNIASEIGFYGKGHTTTENITSQNLFGKNGLMFGMWASSPPSTRGVVIMYSLKKSAIDANELADWFESIGPVKRAVVRKNQIVAGHFFYRVGYKFRPPGGDQVIAPD
jgi:dolichol-phosphate mannosyltransferase